MGSEVENVRCLPSSLSQNLQNHDSCCPWLRTLENDTFWSHVVLREMWSNTWDISQKGSCLKTLRCLSMCALLLLKAAADIDDGVEQRIVYKYFSSPGSRSSFLQHTGFSVTSKSVVGTCHGSLFPVSFRQFQNMIPIRPWPRCLSQI